MDKGALRSELRALLERERDKLIAAHKTTSEGVTHEDSHAEGSKDMRATEASYIARGQAERARELIADVEKVAAMKLRSFSADDPIGLSAVVSFRDEHRGERLVFVASAGAGMRVADSIDVMTPRAPLGVLLLGSRRGDVLEIDRGGKVSEIEVLEVR